MSVRALPMLALAAVACNLAPYDWQTGAGGAASTTSTGTTGATTATGATATTEAATTTAASTGGATSSSFLPRPDADPPPCDHWEEDCPEGQKCMPYSSDGDNAWDSLKCVDIVPNPAGVGEPCTASGNGVSGEDTCDKHMMCWDIDPDTLTGTCVAMCIGSPDAPDCADPYATCPIAGDGTLTLCFPPCDPIANDCPGGDLCVPHPGHPGKFFCALDASDDEGQLFDPCDYINGCDPGLFCADPPMFAVECDPLQIGCCLPFCDLDDPNTCPGRDLQCLPSYDDPAGVAPFNLDVGLCQIPMP